MKKIITIAFFLFYYSINNSCSFSSVKTNKLLTNARTKKYDLIIVPGIPFENGKWNKIMKGRVYWSKYLYDEGIVKNIMYSGSAVYSPYFEAEIMALYAEQIGIPKENIFTEIKAEHSTENIFYSYKKGKKIGFKRIALATDPFQGRMMKRFIRKKMKRKLDQIPIVYDTLKSIESEMIDPTINYSLAFDDNFVSIIERENFCKRLKGSMGLNIDTTFYK